MAEVVLPEHVSRHGAALGSIDVHADTDLDGTGSQNTTPPIQPRTPLWNWQPGTTDTNRRPASASMRIDIPSANPTSAHTRAASVLPSFTFNASDVSGRRDSHTPPRTPEETTAVTPSRTGHRRGGSEFVGGDSRLGVSNALSSSPTKITSSSDFAVPATVPAVTRRGHAHRRSAAISSNDIVKLMQPGSDGQPRHSSSLPNSPLEQPSDVVPNESSFFSSSRDADAFGPPLESPPARPPSRPRVGFSDNVEFIPRPLSTISSETESSLSTIRGHSVNTSISSLLSLSGPSSPASRTPRIPLRTNSEDDEQHAAVPSSAKLQPVGKEEQWVKRRSSDSLRRPMSESAVHAKTAFIDPLPIARSRKRSVSHVLGFDRRRSEPSFSLAANEPSRLSAISLQEAGSSVYTAQDAQETRESEHKSSVRRMKEWATAKISKKAKEAGRALTATSSSSSLRPVSAGSIPPPPRERTESAPAETDLDAVLSHPDACGDSDRSTTPSQALFDINAAVSSQYSGTRLHSYDDSEAVLDLDAALGPFNTPSIGSHRHRKELHSSRLTKDFTGPGLHYHRRAESAPALAPFEYQQGGNASQPEMADVFEEDEEDAMNVSAAMETTRTTSTGDEESATGIVSNSDKSVGDTQPLAQHASEVLSLQDSQEPGRPLSSFTHNRPNLSTLIVDGRGSSIIEETIFEEGSPPCEVEIVDADDEPRASSLTKSSDSSDTPTLLVPPSGPLTVSDARQSLTTSDSNYSSPIIRPGSLSSCTTGEQSQDMRLSVEVPSLISSRSTMMSTVHDNDSRRDVSDAIRAASVTPHPAELSTVSELRRKRGSIQSLSQLVGGSFGARFGASSHDIRPQTASDPVAAQAAAKKENRLKKLIFWKTKRQPRRELPSNP